jgi:archaellum component FlaC
MSSNVIIPSSVEDKKRIKGCIEEISNSLTRIDSEKAFIKEAVESCAEDVAIDKKHLRKMANIHHKQNLSEVVGEIEDVEALYEGVMV